MIVKGTLVNVATILGGTCIGAVLKQEIPEKYQTSVMQALALSVFLIGLQMALKTQNILIVILSLTGGAILGEAVNIDGKLTAFGEWITKKIGSKQSTNIGQAFITTSLGYCAGALSVVGAFQDGLTGDASTLYAKSMLDGIASILFTLTLGIGVALSAVSILLYQGSLTLLAAYISPYLSEAMIRELTAVGGLLIIGISLSMLDYKKIKVANWLPALPLAIIISLLWPV
jgi:uncharacterized membrane protein YqgA involved in biofilm formation